MWTHYLEFQGDGSTPKVAWRLDWDTGDAERWDWTKGAWIEDPDLVRMLSNGEDLTPCSEQAATSAIAGRGKAVPVQEHGDKQRMSPAEYSRFHPGSDGGGSARPLAEALEKARRELRTREENERAIVIGPDGTVVLDKVGEARGVNFTLAEDALMKDGVLVHNHPSGLSFSPDDLDVAAFADMAAIEAIGTDQLGRHWHYTLTRPPGGWPVPDKSWTFANIASAQREEIRARVDLLRGWYARTLWRKEGFKAGSAKWQEMMGLVESPAVSGAAWTEATINAQIEAQHVNTAVAAKLLGAPYERVAW